MYYPDLLCTLFLQGFKRITGVILFQMFELFFDKALKCTTLARLQGEIHLQLRPQKATIYSIYL